MLIGGSGNVGVFVSDKNVIMVDNKYKIVKEVLISSPREITSNPIQYIINTHYHHVVNSVIPATLALQSLLYVIPSEPQTG